MSTSEFASRNTRRREPLGRITAQSFGLGVCISCNGCFEKISGGSLYGKDSIFMNFVLKGQENLSTAFEKLKSRFLKETASFVIQKLLTIIGVVEKNRRAF